MLHQAYRWGQVPLGIDSSAAQEVVNLEEVPTSRPSHLRKVCSHLEPTQETTNQIKQLLHLDEIQPISSHPIPYVL